MKPGQMRIFNALVSNVEGLSYTELIEQTKVSNTALARYLKSMQKTGLVRKDFENRKYTLAQIYYPLKMLPNDYQKALKIFGVAIIKKAKTISEMKPSKKRKMTFQKFLDATFQYFTVTIWKVIGEAIAVYNDKMENVKDQDLTVQMDAIVNRAFNNWINPIASCIAVSLSLNLDLTDDAEEFFGEVLKEATQKLNSI